MKNRWADEVESAADLAVAKTLIAYGDVAYTAKGQMYAYGQLIGDLIRLDYLPKRHGGGYSRVDVQGVPEAVLAGSGRWGLAADVGQDDPSLEEAWVCDELSVLGDRNSEIAWMVWIDGDDCVTVGKRFGLSKQRVSQILQAAKDTIGRRLKRRTI
mgnify:CR=1 FL=1